MVKVLVQSPAGSAVSGRGVTWEMVGVSLLIIFVPLVPFRYLVLPNSIPLVIQTSIRYMPTAVCLVLSCLWMWRSRRDLVTTIGSTPLGWPVVALLATGLFSSMGAKQPVMSVAKTVYYFVSGGMLYLLTVNLVKGELKRGWTLLCCLLATGCAVSVYGILEFAAGVHLAYGSVFAPENVFYQRLIPDPWFARRIVATIGHPVVLGSYLLILLPLSLSAALGSYYRWQQTAWAAVALILLMGLVLTFTRGAWLAAGASLGTLLLLRGRRYVLALPVALLLVGGIAMSVGGIAEVVLERVGDTYHYYILNFASTTRGAAYGFVVVIASRFPALGLGTGMYRFTAYDLRIELDIPTPLGVLDTPDNMYLMWLADNGVVGLIAAAYVLALLFRTFWLAGKCVGDVGPRCLAHGFFAALVGMCVQMLTVDALYFPVIRIVFWILVGLGVGMLAPRRQVTEGD
jgi:hypothetical protein